MVQVSDEGLFDAPIDKIWKYLNDQDPKTHVHKAIRGQKVLEQKGNAMFLELDALNPDGKTIHKEKVKMTMNPPKGFDWEVLSGPMTGTKFTNSYAASGAKTKVTVRGDFKIQGMDDSSTKKAILAYLDNVFNEDQANLKRFK